MTLQYPKLPDIPRERPVAPTAVTEEWQAANEPLVTMRVWLGPDGRGLISVRWSAEINAAPLHDKPLLEMHSAMTHLHSQVDVILDGLAAHLAPLVAAARVEGES